METFSRGEELQLLHNLSQAAGDGWDNIPHSLFIYPVLTDAPIKKKNLDWERLQRAVFKEQGHQRQLNPSAGTNPNLDLHPDFSDVLSSELIPAWRGCKCSWGCCLGGQIKPGAGQGGIFGVPGAAIPLSL